MELVPPSSHEDLTPLERAKQRELHKWLTELFGLGYDRQPYHPIKVHHVHLENVATEIWADLEPEFFGRSPSYEEIQAALAALNDGYLPKGFIIQGRSELEPEADLHRRDVAGWVDGAFEVAGSMGFIGPKQLTFEEE